MPGSNIVLLLKKGQFRTVLLGFYQLYKGIPITLRNVINSVLMFNENSEK